MHVHQHTSTLADHDLKYWLFRLVTSKKTVQRQAAEQLQALEKASMDQESRPTATTHQCKPFEEELQDLLSSPDFPMEAYFNQIAHWFHSGRVISSSDMPVYLSLCTIIENAGYRLMQYPCILERLMTFSYSHRSTETLLNSLGRRAASFAPYILSRLDNTEEERQFTHASLLGCIGADDAYVVDALLSRLYVENLTIRHRAAEVLSHLAPYCAGRTEELFERMQVLYLAASAEESWHYFNAWVSLGRGKADVRKAVLDCTLPKPPRIQTFTEGSHRWQQDTVMWDRGRAIGACEYLVDWPDEVIPVLAQSLITFEEYDPDYQYDGDHVRVCQVLSLFGTKAVFVLPQVMSLLRAWLDNRDPNKELCKDLLRVIQVMGPLAREALPLLLELRPCDQHESLDPVFEDDKAIMSVLGQIDLIE